MHIGENNESHTQCQILNQHLYRVKFDLVESRYIYTCILNWNEKHQDMMHQNCK